ncbi:MAG TPA: nucleotidyl transferase AbiEii/AbiGii toxin family protein [Rhizomicrobium sp.]
MANKAPTNIAASIRARLLNLARQTGKPFDVLLTRFVHERLLYRLSRSRHADRFVLKGAMLLTTWLPETARGTRDLDLLAFGDSSEQRILGIFRDIMSEDAGDGIEFDPEGLQASRIREELEYGGLRLRGKASLSGARIAILIDIGFGDSVEPGLETIEYPALLDLPSPKLRAYAPETVIAEKFQAMIALGRANSRMKDFYDIWALSKVFAFDNDRLARAIAATFARRQTTIPTEVPDALTPAFAQDPAKQRQWAAFISDIVNAPPTLQLVTQDITDILMGAAKIARAVGAT